jgi:hypothetical protein
VSAKSEHVSINRTDGKQDFCKRLSGGLAVGQNPGTFNGPWGLSMPDIALVVVAVLVVLYFAIRLTLRHYFPPET